MEGTIAACGWNIAALQAAWGVRAANPARWAGLRNDAPMALERRPQHKTIGPVETVGGMGQPDPAWLGYADPRITGLLMPAKLCSRPRARDPSARPNGLGDGSIRRVVRPTGAR